MKDPSKLSSLRDEVIKELFIAKDQLITRERPTNVAVSVTVNNLSTWYTVMYVTKVLKMNF